MNAATDKKRGCSEGKTPGQLAYEEDVRRRPNYDSGKPRKSWDALPEHVKQTWHEEPTAREWRKWETQA